MKIKTAALFLIIASSVELLIQVYWKIKTFSSVDESYYSQNRLDFVLSFLWMLLPLALLFLGLALHKNEGSMASPVTQTPSAVTQTEDAPSVGDWFLNFFLAAIPLIGLILLIVWANDDSNKIRKNWAIAQLLWAVLIFVIVFLLVISTLNSRGRLYY